VSSGATKKKGRATLPIAIVLPNALQRPALLIRHRSRRCHASRIHCNARLQDNHGCCAVHCRSYHDFHLHCRSFHRDRSAHRARACLDTSLYSLLDQ
ncbi:hypothetical protein C8J57DRAFT_1705392, partial [Mycena rebaudengoi]